MKATSNKHRARRGKERWGPGIHDRAGKERLVLDLPERSDGCNAAKAKKMKSSVNFKLQTLMQTERIDGISQEDVDAFHTYTIQKGTGVVPRVRSGNL